MLDSGAGRLSKFAIMDAGVWTNPSLHLEASSQVVGIPQVPRYLNDCATMSPITITITSTGGIDMEHGRSEHEPLAEKTSRIANCSDISSSAVLG
jgi:hypothetical protein